MRRGFTLVELIMVVGILGVLAALVFPALHSAHERGLDAKCKNNLRELAGAAILYSDEHRGQFPWAMRTWSDCWDFKTIHGEYVMGEMWEYTSSKDILACPKCYGKNDNWAGIGFTGYNYNSCYAGKVKGDPGKRQSPSRVQNFPNPSKMALFGDAGYGDPEQMNKFMRAPRTSKQFDRSGASLRKAGTQSFRHLGHSNVSFADGHVESMFISYKADGNKGFVSGHTGFLSPDNELYSGGLEK